MTRWHLYYFFQWFSLGTDFNLRVPLLRQSVLDYFRNRGMHHIITARQWSCGKVMVLYMSVHQSVCPQGDYPWFIGTHCTDPCPSPALYMGPQGPPLPLLLVTSGSHHWRPVQTCSLQYSPPVLTSSGRWSMVTSTHPTGILYFAIKWYSLSAAGSGGCVTGGAGVGGGWTTKEALSRLPSDVITALALLAPVCYYLKLLSSSRTENFSWKITVWKSELTWAGSGCDTDVVQRDVGPVTRPSNCCVNDLKE